MLKKVIISTALTVGFVVLLRNRIKASSSKGFFQSPTKKLEFRKCDLLGCGDFGATRVDNKKHAGVDIVVIPNERIYSPLEGIVNRSPIFPYTNSSYRGIEIKGINEFKGFVVKVFYLSPKIEEGVKLKKGNFIGYAQDISQRKEHYKNKMTPHIHLEVRKDNVLIDPTLLF